MVHVSSQLQPRPLPRDGSALHQRRAPTAFMQLIQGDLFADFPELRLDHPARRRSGPYHWGRYRGLADMLKRAAPWRPRDEKRLLRHLRLPPAGHRPALEVIDLDNILFGSEMVGAVRGIDPRDRPLLRRHQAVHRRARPHRGRSGEKVFERQRPPRVPAPRRRAEGTGAVTMPTAFTPDAGLAAPTTRNPTKPSYTAAARARWTRTATCSGPATCSRTRRSASTPRSTRARSSCSRSATSSASSATSIVQATCHGADNSAMVDALRSVERHAPAASPPSARDVSRRRAAGAARGRACAACGSTSSSASSTPSRTTYYRRIVDQQYIYLHSVFAAGTGES